MTFPYPNCKRDIPDSFRRRFKVERDVGGLQTRVVIPPYPETRTDLAPIIIRPEHPGVRGTRTILEYREEGTKVFDRLRDALYHAYGIGLWAGHVAT